MHVACMCGGGRVDSRETERVGKKEQKRKGERESGVGQVRRQGLSMLCQPDPCRPTLESTVGRHLAITYNCYALDQVAVRSVCLFLATLHFMATSQSGHLFCIQIRFMTSAQLYAAPEASAKSGLPSYIVQNIEQTKTGCMKSIIALYATEFSKHRKGPQGNRERRLVRLPDLAGPK